MLYAVYYILWYLTSKNTEEGEKRVDDWGREWEKRIKLQSKTKSSHVYMENELTHNKSARSP